MDGKRRQEYALGSLWRGGGNVTLRPASKRHMSARHKQILGLDVVRFFAASSVALFHLAYSGWAQPRPAHFALVAGLPPWGSFFSFGWIGVEIFFVLSGFVIAYSAEDATPFEFALSRISRLVPALWAAAPITLAIWIALGVPSNPLVPLVKSLLFFPFGPLLNPVYWTLGIEVAFYTLIFLLLCGRNFRRLEWVATALALMGAAFWALMATGLISDHFPRFTQLLLFAQGSYFALGITIWAIYRRGISLRRIAVCFLCVAAAYPEIRATTALNARGVALSDLQTQVPFLVWLAAVAAIALSVAYNGKLWTVFGRHNRLIRFLGLLTYPLYLIHGPVGGAVLVLGQAAGLSPWLSVPLGLGAGIVAALFICVVAEPLIRKGVVRVANFIGDALRLRLGAGSFLFRQ
jgi:peptidoglycan/LPS O-acetylase OafA/YrhL